MTGQLDHREAVRTGSGSGPMPIVDGHFHLWSLEELDYPWLAPGAPPRFTNAGERRRLRLVRAMGKIEPEDIGAGGNQRVEHVV